MDYSVKFVLFTLIGLKVKVGGLRVKFVNNFQILIINYFCKSNLKSHIFTSFSYLS